MMLWFLAYVISSFWHGDPEDIILTKVKNSYNSIYYDI